MGCTSLMRKCGNALYTMGLKTEKARPIRDNDKESSMEEEAWSMEHGARVCGSYGISSQIHSWACLG